MDKNEHSSDTIYDIKLKYALRDDKLISIDEITREQNGLKCNCICPGCGQRLQARLGNGKKQPHFAHNGESCNLIVAHQSALHILAKEIIQEEMKVCLPALKVKIDDIIETIPQRYYYEVPQEMVYKASQVFECEGVELEKRVSDIVPDVIVKIGGKECLIEIAVTHFIDEVKSEKIKRIGLPVVEIDLSDYSGEDYSKENIRKLLLEDNDLKKWIYNPISDKAYEWAKEEYKKLVDNFVKDEEERQKKEREKRENREQKRLISQTIIDGLQDENNYKQSIFELRNDTKTAYYLRRRTFYSDNFVLPFFMDIPITGEMVFNCDRRIWQSALFDKFVYNRKPDEQHIITLIRVNNWAVKYQEEFKINWNMTSKARFCFGNTAAEQNLFQCCLKEYLHYLSYLGFISKKSYSGDYYTLAINTLQPPNQKAALRLEKVIKEVNQYSWDVTKEIYDLIQPNRVYKTIYNINEREEKGFLPDESFEKSISEKDRRDKLKRIDYEAELEEVISKNLLIEGKIAKDSFGYKWFICNECGVIKREDELVEYKGIHGFCRECYLREKTDK